MIFTGYLTHRELRHLFPCCDAAVFPSLVKEAGPLVFLEALASGALLVNYMGHGSVDTWAGALLTAEDAASLAGSLLLALWLRGTLRRDWVPSKDTARPPPLERRDGQATFINAPGVPI